ncbi:MAG: tRNA pseudouridine(38-40) synthase TruA [Rhabdochlamydiaceae bacterium]
MNHKIAVAYDGTAYSGWQHQSSQLSIQQVIEHSLSTVLREPIKIQGSGRTDAGVHALEQIAHFHSSPILDLRRTIFSLNALLPKDIRILSLQATTDDFHARFSCLSKVYQYHLDLSPHRNPFKRFYSYRPFFPIDLDLMREGFRYLVGEHDFSSFSHQANKGSAAINPIRHLYRIDLIENTDDVYLEFEADGFLYKMVRNLTAALLAVGNKKIKPVDLEFLREKKNRSLLPQTAPPHGLFLFKVKYPIHFESPI